MRISEYFRQIDETIDHCPGVSLRTMLYDERSETKGFIRGLIHFEDGSELHVREFVDVSSGIDRYKYSYHYMRMEEMIFRYDNSADITARELAIYPHHKHVGEVIEESPALTLQEVLEEITGSLP
ncbi:MAG: toxin-antitoxin system TumE family protein [Candidatus Entotheonellia bacterium]